MRKIAEPYFVILARRRFGLPMGRWYPCLEITPKDDHTMLASIAERICTEFNGTVVERYGHEGGKEYWWISVGATTLLLMRKSGIGLLGDHPADIDLVKRIGSAFGANPVGWRWRLWSRLHGKLRPSEVREPIK
jgi:hypothetical protein